MISLMLIRYGSGQCLGRRFSFFVYVALGSKKRKCGLEGLNQMGLLNQSWGGPRPLVRGLSKTWKDWHNTPSPPCVLQVFPLWSSPRLIL